MSAGVALLGFSYFAQPRRVAGTAYAAPVDTWHAAGSSIEPVPQGPIDGCPMLPADNIWNTRVDSLPVDPRSDAYVQTIGAAITVHPDFGSGLWDGGRIGIPYAVVDGAQPRVDLSFQWPGESDAGPYPIPTDAPIEGPPGRGDRHILIVDRDACVLYEVYRAVWQSDGSIDADSGAIYDLRSNAPRPAGWTSADAAGLPILTGLVRYDEVASGVIDHAVRFTVEETRAAYVWPGRHLASDLMEVRYPPMGQRFRLKANVSTAGFSASARTIAEALKSYGMILADNGSNWFLSGVPDERWDNDSLRDLRALRGSDFEAVDVSSLMIDPDSGQVRGAVVASPTPTSGPDTPTAATPTDTPTVAPSDTPTAATSTATANPFDPSPTDGTPPLATHTPDPTRTPDPTLSPDPTVAPTAIPGTPPGGAWRLYLPTTRSNG